MTHSPPPLSFSEGIRRPPAECGPRRPRATDAGTADNRVICDQQYTGWNGRPRPS